MADPVTFCAIKLGMALYGIYQGVKVTRKVADWAAAHKQLTALRKSSVAQCEAAMKAHVAPPGLNTTVQSSIIAYMTLWGRLQKTIDALEVACQKKDEKMYLLCLDAVGVDSDIVECAEAANDAAKAAALAKKLGTK